MNFSYLFYVLEMLGQFLCAFMSVLCEMQHLVQKGVTCIVVLLWFHCT